MKRQALVSLVQRPWGAATYLVRLGRQAGLRAMAAAVRRQLWSERRHLGLRCDLSCLPPAPAARIPVEMHEPQASRFHGFERERGRVGVQERADVLFRGHALDRGLRAFHVALADGLPVYGQWLVRPDQQAMLDALSPGDYRPLRPDEVLLEHAYTFVDFRGQGAMAAGMAQLLRRARAGGAAWALTYVGADNVASLRGCARVGFVPDHWRTTRIRLGLRRTVFTPLDAPGRAAWAQATTPAAPAREASRPG